MPPFFSPVYVCFLAPQKPNPDNRPRKRKTSSAKQHLPHTRKCTRQNIIPRARVCNLRKRNYTPAKLRIAPVKKNKIAHTKEIPRNREAAARARKGIIRFSPSAIPAPAPATCESAITLPRNFKSCPQKKLRTRKKFPAIAKPLPRARKRKNPFQPKCNPPRPRLQPDESATP